MPPVSLKFAATCLAILLAGCASYRAAPLSPAENAAAIDARSLDDARLRKFITIEFGDATPSRSWDLARLTLAALYFHPDLDVARARLASAQAAVLTADQRPNPTLNVAAVLGTSATAGAITAGALPLLVGPTIDFVIETADKREDRTAKAGHLVDAARAALGMAGWQVRGRVRVALIALWAAQRRLALMQGRLTLQQELVGLLESRFAAGAANSLDVARERIRRAQFALAGRDEESALADARARLATAVGIPLTALDGVALSLGTFDRPAPLPPGISVDALRRRALTRRPDVAAALAEYEAAQSGLQLAIAGQYPNVTVGPGYQYDFGVNKYLLGPSLVLPIFNQNQGPIAEAIAARQEAAARFTALQAAIIGAIDRAVADYRAANAALVTAEALVTDARRRKGQAQSSFAAGGIDRPTLIAAEIEQEAAELSRLDAAVKQRQALGSLEDALQHPLFEPAAPFLAPEESPRFDAEPGT